MEANDLFSFVGDLPVVDWHNHLDMAALAADAQLGSLYSVWVAPDPYKHRAMRICGVPERLVTGDAPEAEKWAAWQNTLPKLVGNPLFDWAKAELSLVRIDPGPYLRGQGANVSLSSWTPSRVLRAANAEILSPCVGVDCEISRLVPPRAASRETPLVVPSLRLNAGDTVSEETLERFAAAGCRVVDISVDDTLALSREAQNTALCSAPGAKAPGLSPGLFRIAAFAAAHGWTMLLHLGALRATSARLRAIAGPAGGFAVMRAPVDPVHVAAFLDALERAGALPRTILLTLNPEAHAQIAVLSGSFTREGSPGHVQLGPAWWWCDHAHGVRDVLEKTAAYGVLSAFVGMTTDSRSLLSLARHDWFRRTLCKWVAEKVASGDFPDDPALLRPLLENICYLNARRIFDGNR
ncbi:MAG: glucuronate isomerase [Kiritimatiellae bacterium]|nr:glucuronate isomerase [Kiritimatiellia bacterium]